MRRRARLAIAAAALVAALAVAAVAVAAGSGSTSGAFYRVDAIFDTAKGIVPGQLVKVAGARAGEVDDVSLTPDYRARLELSIDPRFSGFRSDATCAIQPEGLIGENFVQCDPGTPAGKPLPETDGVPTLPIERTRIPVNISDLFQIWTAPVRRRLPLAVNTLGAGFAARGADVNAIIRRANPALAATRKAIRTVRAESDDIKALIDSTDTVAAELAGRRQDVGEFLDSASSVATKAGEHDTAIAEAIRRAPDLLSATRPALDRIDELTDRGTPILRDLRQASPDLRRFANQLEPVGNAARTAMPKLSRAIATGRRATEASTPIATDVSRFARLAAEPSRELGDTFASLQKTGFVESLLRFVYNFSAASARYDDTSHLVPLLLTVNGCSLTLGLHSEACSAGYGGQGKKSSAATPKRASKGGDARPDSEAKATAPKLAKADGTGKPAEKRAAPTADEPDADGEDASRSPRVLDSVRGLLDYLLK